MCTQPRSGYDDELCACGKCHSTRAIEPGEPEAKPVELPTHPREVCDPAASRD